MKLGVYFTILYSAVTAKKKKQQKPKNYYAPEKNGVDPFGYTIGKRHPLMLLSSANKFFCKKVANKYERPKQGERACSRFKNMASRFSDQFANTKFSYYDPKVKNGGPNPDPMAAGHKLKTTKSGDKKWVPRTYYRKLRNLQNDALRIRRDDEDDENEDADYDDEYEFAECDETEQQNSEMKWLCDSGDYMETETEEWVEITAENCVGAECHGRRNGQKKKKKKVKKVKLTGTEKKLKRSLLGVALFCRRHLSENPGQRSTPFKEPNCIKRVRNIWDATRPRLTGFKALLDGQVAPTLVAPIHEI